MKRDAPPGAGPPRKFDPASVARFVASGISRSDALAIHRSAYTASVRTTVTGAGLVSAAWQRVSDGASVCAVLSELEKVGRPRA